MTSIKSSILDLLEKHNCRESVVSIVFWEDKRKSGFLFFGGVLLFLLVHVLNVGMLTVVGTLAILQLVVYRTAEALQTRGILIKQEIDLKEVIVVTPDPATVSTTVEIIGDALRNVEESIKEISLTSDYAKLSAGIATLVFLSAVGRVISLPVLLLLAHLATFTVPIFYTLNQEKIDQIVGNALEAAQLFLDNNNIKVKLQ